MILDSKSCQHGMVEDNFAAVLCAVSAVLQAIAAVDSTAT